MFVCICHAITEKDIENAVANGAGSMKALREQLNVASQCGKCSQFAKSVLDNHLFNYDLAVEAKRVA
ncbi:bacterioferritin-associated ferredoxin [Thalassotalea aquiviva]|uniref:bacterioferritin-associated ferredoxin n=1 Tax=Thalassotalea aquiviva TaxID=3242415 RepID=UPI00352A6623